MKKLLFIFILIPVLLSAGCAETEMVKEETYSVENIKFKKGSISDNSNLIIIDTNKESLVVELWDTQFIKTTEPSTTIHAQWVIDPLRGELITSKIYVSESDIQEISRAYTDKFEETMAFEMEGK